MSKITITLSLPDKLATEAEAKGLLRAETIELLLREELRRRRISGLFKAADKLANLRAITLTDLEVEAEIQAARKSRGLRHASGS